MASLAERVALVTGSTSGIGLGIAAALAAEGADIVMHGLGSDAAIEAARRSIAATSTSSRWEARTLRMASGLSAA